MLKIKQFTPNERDLHMVNLGMTLRYIYITEILQKKNLIRIFLQTDILFTCQKSPVILFCSQNSTKINLTRGEIMFENQKENL